MGRFISILGFAKPAYFLFLASMHHTRYFGKTIEEAKPKKSKTRNLGTTRQEMPKGGTSDSHSLLLA